MSANIKVQLGLDRLAREREIEATEKTTTAKRAEDVFTKIDQILVKLQKLDWTNFFSKITSIEQKSLT